MNEISVKVSKFGDRRFFLMYYDCPLSGKRKSRSTKTENKREAEKLAAKWEAELREGRYKPLANISWDEFRERYELEAGAAMAESSQKNIATTFNSIERVLNPKRLRDVTEERLSYYQSKLREEKLADATIKTYLATLAAALSWAGNLKLLTSVPKLKSAKRAKYTKLMKGRAIIGEEFERMMGKVEAGLMDIQQAYTPRKTRKTVRSDEANKRRRNRQQANAQAAAPVWRRLLLGLKLSGLRLGEALNLSWDDQTKILVDLSGKRPMLKILAELEKGGKDRIHPITPDFAEFLLATPANQRRGPVFPINGHSVSGDAVSLKWASKVISAIGKAAGIVVDHKTGKTASAHDLRRTFGEKWSKIVMPAVLQQLMRHEDIGTTMAYYVGQNAESTADAVWEAMARQSTVSSTVTKKASESSDSEAQAKSRKSRAK